MTAEKYLLRASELEQEINRKIDRLGDLYASVTKSTTQLSDMPGGGHNNRAFEEGMEKYLLLRDEINEDLNRLIDLKSEIYAAIDALPVEKYRGVLEKFYLLGMTLKEIGRDMGYEKHYVARMKKKALRMIQLPKGDNAG